MAFLDAEGWDGLITADLSTKFIVTNSPTLGAYGQGGRTALRCPGGSAYVGRVLPAMESSFVTGFKVYIEDTLSSRLCILSDGTYPYDLGAVLALHVNADGSVRVQQGPTNFSALGGPGTELFTSAPGTITVGAWHEIQWKGTLSTSTGTIALKVNGALLCDLTGLNTLSDHAGVSIAYLGCGANIVRYADWFVLNQTNAGDGLDTFLPDGFLVESQNAQAGNGTRAEWTPSTGADRGAMVDDPTGVDGDATYNAAGTVGLRDSYVYPALTRVDTVLAIRAEAIARHAGAGARALKLLTVVGGTDYLDATDRYLSSSYGVIGAHWSKNPATAAAWTLAQANAAEHGQQVTV
jgi:hypothetical protein